MKERPILFSGAMVRALLKGTKTQTRRVVKLRDGSRPDESSVATFEDGRFDKFMDFTRAAPYWEPVKSPHGEIGDLLWVRETHAPMLGGGWVYAEDYTAERLKQKDGKGFWKPSIFMKREASRITLEIVCVRVERLQEISEADAIAEGIHRFEVGECEYFHWRKTAPTEEHFTSSVMAYRDLWQSINGAESWTLNPWVWVIEFKRVEVGS